MEYKWNVTFDGCYFENHNNKRGTQEVLINREFEWDGETVHIPAVYLCSKGLVIDVLLEVDKNKVWNALEKFNLLNDECGSSLTRDQRDDLARENPLSRHFDASVIVNKKFMRQDHSSACSWIPDLPEEYGPSDEAKEIIEHYGKDLDKAWSVHRMAFRWTTVKKPKVSNLTLTLIVNEESFPAEHFKNPAIGDKFEITDPTNGKKHTLTVENIDHNSFDGFPLAENGKEFPKNYTVMTYTVYPDISMREFHIEDCFNSDVVRITKPAEHEGHFTPSVEAEAIGIIGGADGPIAIITGSRQNRRTATSAVHFDKEYDIEWRAVFRKKVKTDFMAKLI